MTSLLKLIIFTLFITYVQCYVVFGTTEIDNEEEYADDYNKFAQGHREPAEHATDSHIGIIIKPSEINEPKSLQEIINFVGSDILSNTEEPAAGETNGDGDGRETLTYTELSKLLSFYQWAKEHNFYEMPTETTNGESNVVTV